MPHSTFLVSIFLLCCFFSCTAPEDVEPLPLLQVASTDSSVGRLDWFSLIQPRHRPHYFGKWEDTLQVVYSAWPSPPPPPPPGDTTAYDWRFEEQPFADYFAHEPHSTEFREADSAELWLRIDTSQPLMLYPHQAYPVFVRNRSTDTLKVGYGGASYLILQV